jgi:MFS family permease
VYSGFFVHKWDYSNNKASRISGICYDCVLVLSPIAGMFIDAIGHRGFVSMLLFVLLVLLHHPNHSVLRDSRWLTLGGTVLTAITMTMPAMMVFAATTWPPWIGMVLLGLSLALAASCLWPSVALLVPIRAVGSGLGVMRSVQMLCVAIWNILVGYSLDLNGYLSMVGATFHACLRVRPCITDWLLLLERAS